LEQLFFTALTIQAFYYLIVFGKLYLYKARPKVENNPIIPVSVVICARNEAVNLSENLSKILEQKYPQFEVIVVDDASSDSTPQVLKSLKKLHPNLSIHRIEPANKIMEGKKQALALGISKAKHEHILLTDADCKPSGKHWITSMTDAFGDNNTLVLGLAPYYHKNGLLSDLVTYETAMTALQYVSYALWQMPYMGVGRNMAYTKTLFAMSGMAKLHQDIPSGDDDLLVQAAGKYASSAVCINKNSLMWSNAPETWRAWFRQKLRHYTTGSRYQFFHRFFLGAFLVSKLMLFISGIYLLIVTGLSLKISIALGVYFLMGVAALAVFKRKSGMPVHLKLSPLLDLMYSFLVPILGLIATFRRPGQWK
jgi:cellulose synthase/poly-beta-1,6-N-acetylglucosamine synthase-like glycosyltransferase